MDRNRLGKGRVAEEGEGAFMLNRVLPEGLSVEVAFDIENSNSKNIILQKYATFYFFFMIVTQREREREAET